MGPRVRDQRDQRKSLWEKSPWEKSLWDGDDGGLNLSY